MKQSPRLTTKTVADYLNVSQRRINAKIAQGHFPHASPCECGMKILIPVTDVVADCKRPNRGKPGRKPNAS
jgi:excisionase family DNA binding protein